MIHYLVGEFEQSAIDNAANKIVYLYINKQGC